MQLFRKLLSLLLTLVLTYWMSLPHLAFSQTASSTSYKLLSDSTSNCGGGFSSSTNYKMFDSICQQAAENTSSTSYSIQGGFQGQSDTPSLTVDYSTTAVAFNTLSRTEVKTSSVVVTVTTNASNGYSISVLADGHLRKSSAAADTTNANEIIAQVTDGTVTAGGNEYGVSTSTTDFSVPTSTPRILNSNTGTASEEITTVTFKAAASDNTASGTYTQSMTIITTATF